MRYLSLILLLVLMAWSWAAVHRPPSVSEWVHWNLQEELRQIIIERINLSSENQVRGIRFKKLWTENLEDNQVKAHFQYMYENEDSVSSGIQGYMVLRVQENGGDSSWEITKFHIFKESLVFEEGLKVHSSGEQR